MRAITGAIVSSKPCSLAKAAAILERFCDSAAAHLPSADCATYLRTAAEAASQHSLFRRDLRTRLQQGAPANVDAAHGHEGPVKGDRKRQDREREGAMAVHRDSAAKAEVEVASGERKSKKKMKKEYLQEDRAVAGADSHIPSSPGIVIEKRKNKEKHPNQETIVTVKQEPDLVVEEELGSEKKKRKKKKEKDHVKLEEEDANEVAGKIGIVSYGAGEEIVAGGEHKRRRKNHEKDVKEEKKTAVPDGDLDTEKKGRKKRGRGEHDDSTQDQVEHTKKKQRKQS